MTFKGPLAALGAFALIAATASPASAAFILRLDDGTNFVEVTDNGAGDANPLVGLISYSDGIGGVFGISVNTGMSKPLGANDGDTANLHLNAVVSASGAGTVTVSLADTHFDLSPYPAAVATASVSSSNAVGGTSTFQSWVNPNNLAAPPGTTIPGGSIPLFPGGGYVNPNIVGSSVAPSAEFNPDLFALFTRAIVSFTGAGFASFDSDLNVAAVPEPGSMMLLGTGLVGLAKAARRRYGKGRA